MSGENAIKVVKGSRVKEFDEPTFARIKNLQFTNGLIEAKVLSRLRKNAPPFARGFIGITFRIDDANTRFESIYLRPANARVEKQGRRNHSIQYCLRHRTRLRLMLKTMGIAYWTISILKRRRN